MSFTTLAATLFSAGDLRVTGRDLGPLLPGMVRVAFGAGGICGSDMHYFRHGRSGDFHLTSPLVLGHEMAGKVVESRDSALQPGTRVAINPARWCGTCSPCKTGRPNLCENIHFMGSASKTPHMQGGFSSLFDVTPAQCIAIPAHISFEAAALAEPLAVCLHAVQRASTQKGDTLSGKRALVMGAGPIGLLTMLAARQAGLASIAVADITPAPLMLASKLGADEVVDLATTGDAAAALAQSAPFDIVFEASGSAQALAMAIIAVRRGGTIVQIGNLPAGFISLPANAIMAREIDLRGSFRFGHEFGLGVELIASGAIPVEALITGRLPLAQAAAALELAHDKTRSMKVMLLGEDL